MSKPSWPYLSKNPVLAPRLIQPAPTRFAGCISPEFATSFTTASAENSLRLWRSGTLAAKQGRRYDAQPIHQHGLQLLARLRRHRARPLGAKLAHTLPDDKLKRFFAVFLAALGGRMLLLG